MRNIILTLLVLFGVSEAYSQVACARFIQSKTSKNYKIQFDASLSAVPGQPITSYTWTITESDLVPNQPPYSASITTASPIYSHQFPSIPGRIYKVCIGVDYKFVGHVLCDEGSVHLPYCLDGFAPLP